MSSNVYTFKPFKSFILCLLLSMVASKILHPMSTSVNDIAYDHGRFTSPVQSFGNNQRVTLKPHLINFLDFVYADRICNILFSNLTFLSQNWSIQNYNQCHNVILYTYLLNICSHSFYHIHPQLHVKCTHFKTQKCDVHV